jgi:hypothetical protein
MKNKFIYIVAGLLMLSTAACKEEFLEILPYDEATVDGYYRNEAEIKSVTGSLYGRPWFEYNDKFGWVVGDGMAGDLFNDYQDEGQIYLFALTDNNTVISNGWRGLYNVVAYANSVINDMPRVASGNGVPENAINAGLGEARFMRAYAYYLLTENWGEVPIIESAAQLISNNNIQVEKNTTASLYEFIIRDLEFAAMHLPSSDEPGRVTQWAAKGLLAKIHLTRGQRFKSADDFNKAKSLAQEVIESSGFSLMSNYADLFKIENNNNQESLFALQWISGSWGFGNSRQAVFARNEQITNNGEAWGGGKGATFSFRENLLDNAEGKKDLRRPSIYMTKGDHYPEMRKDRGGYTYNIVTPDPEGGNNIESAGNQLNHIKKYVVGTRDDVGAPVSSQAVPLNLYMLRLADVYLIYVEAAIGTASSTSDGKALEYLNAIRSRAGLDPRSGSVTFEQVFNERRVEFGMEGINMLDVKRWFYRDGEAALQYLRNQKRERIYARTYDPEALPEFEAIGDETSEEGYMVVEAGTFHPAESVSAVTVNPDNLFLPVPNTEVAQNPNLAKEAKAVDYKFE